MEKAVINHLLHIVDAKPPADALHVHAGGLQPLPVIQRNALHALHHQDALGGQLAVDLGAEDVFIILVQVGKFLDVIRLQQKIHLLLGNLPHLIHDALQIDNTLRIPHQIEEGNGLFQEGDILGHHLINTGTLHLDNNPVTVQKARPVHLGNGSGAHGMLINRGENPVPALVVLPLDNLLHHGKIHGLHLGLQPGQLRLVLIGQKIRPHADNLPQLHKSRSQILQHLPHLHRGYPLQELPVPEHCHNFLQPPGRGNIHAAILSLSQKLPQHSSCHLLASQDAPDGNTRKHLTGHL